MLDIVLVLPISQLTIKSHVYSQDKHVLISFWLFDIIIRSHLGQNFSSNLQALRRLKDSTVYIHSYNPRVAWPWNC